MTIVSILLRSSAPELDANGEAVIEEDGTVRWVEPVYEEVDLDVLTPRARALAEAVAQTSLRTAVDIWLESDDPIRDRIPDWQHWYTEEQAARPDRRSWRGWSRFPATSAMSAVDYLEQQARRLPIGWHVLGGSPHTPVPSLHDGQADSALTRNHVLAYLRSKGRNIAVSTWSSYVARGQAPRPARYVGRTPLWDIADLDAFLTRTSQPTTDHPNEV